MEILTWFFTDTIYGLLLLCLPIYGFAWVIKRGIKAAPDPFVVTVIAGAILLTTVPSIPRYQFQEQGLKIRQDHPEYKLVWNVRYGDIFEPLTLFNAPIGFFKFVNPDPLTYRPGEGGRFHTVIHRYKEKRHEFIVDAYCKDNTISLSQPDNSGVFRSSSKEAEQMSKEDIEIYCQTDYSEQMEFMRSNISSSKN